MEMARRVRPVFPGMGFGLRFFRLLPAILLFGVAAARCGEPLLICIPGGAPGRIDSVLGPAISPGRLISFQRVKDLDEIIPSYPGAPVIGSSAYVRYLPGYTILLRGKKGQSKQKKYLIITGNRGITRSNAAGSRIGVLDFLGREKMPAFIEDAFGFPIAKLKRVSKKEDLQSLLGMELVDAAIIEESDLAEMQADTKVKLTVLLESKPMDSFPVFACPEAAECSGLRMKLSGQPKAVLETMGIEGWE